MEVNSATLQSELGLCIDVVAEQSSRVTIDGDRVSESHLSWEEGDEIEIVHNGRSYTYVATESARQARFVPKGEESVLRLADVTAAPIALFYNVKSIDTSALTATFDVSAVQREGCADNRLPLYGFVSTPQLEDRWLRVTMRPLASVVELELGASRSWSSDAVAIAAAQSLSNGYASALNVKIDAATGRLDFDSATLSRGVRVELSSRSDLSIKRRVQFVVMGSSCGESEQRLYPIYYGSTVVSLYKGDVENARRTIWRGYSAPTETVSQSKHIYQPIADMLSEKVAFGVSTAEELALFADMVNSAAESGLAELAFANEDGVVELKSSVDISAYTNWQPIGGATHSFTGTFDGCGNSISGLTINHDSTERDLSALFGVVGSGGVVKNLTIEGCIVESSAVDSTAAGVVAMLSGGVVENCTSKVLFSVGDGATSRVIVGGVVGQAKPTTGDVFISNCKNGVPFELCYSKPIRSYAVVGGVVGVLGGGAAEYTVKVSGCSNSGNLSLFNAGGASMVGGIFGSVNCVDEVAGVASECYNYGDVKIGSGCDSCQSLFIGGIAARHIGHKLANCVNYGTVKLSETTTSPTALYAGGVVGISNSMATLADSEHCENRGDVVVCGVGTLSEEVCVGGVVGGAFARCRMVDNLNFGAVTVDMGDSNSYACVGGVAGLLGMTATGCDRGIELNGCSNSGTVILAGSTVNVQWDYVAGVAGACYGGVDASAEGLYGAHIVRCNNVGIVSARRGQRIRAGGILGRCDATALYNCENSGVVALERQTENADVIAGVVAQLDSGYNIIDGSINSGTVCNLYATKRECDNSTSRHTYVLIGGIVGSGGGDKCVVTNCLSVGKLLSSHDGELEYDEYKGAWVANMAVTTQYRGALFGNAHKSQCLSHCRVGGAVGVVAGGEGEGRYSASVEHKLNNIAGDRYHWQRWIQGYTTVSVYDSLGFAE